MGFFNNIKETLRDKTRDKVCTRLCAIGVESRMAERGRSEEHIGARVIGASLGLIEIQDSPICWVNVVWWVTQGSLNFTMVDRREDTRKEG